MQCRSNVTLSIEKCKCSLRISYSN